ncbi:TPA: hypothetical protein SAO08_002668 [Burkholderia multivorans]|uniref:hypothetical protein n=1 Tax=Burkholderia vietnamiensis TaxID=60552 RepID=UPI00158E6AE2|nr:hypothetical protein [Burkholderia vietnamiensis]HDR9003029.1 hypothetical protein [Burkholderia vietnamiensis]HDR9006927.1 hypothetical protein [Burkholderia vietnamiensis]HEF4742823.1 hypothetical protein [Burkholderia multivorans]
MNAITAAKLVEACKVINTEAINAVAAKNGITVAEVLDAISNGNVRCIAQVKAFQEAGMREAIRLHESGAIALTA